MNAMLATLRDRANRSVTDLPSAFWDYLPTACELAGAKAPARTDGISYLPTLLGEPKRQPRHAHLFWQFGRTGDRRKVAVRAGTWKLVGFGQDKFELYNLSADVGERHDLSVEKPDIVAHLKTMMAQASR